MLKPLVFVIAVGIGIGLLLPSGHHVQAAAATATTDEPQETVLERHNNGHFYVDATVNGHSVPFVVDTGASMVALTEDDARTAGIQFDESEFEPVARSASGIVYGKEIYLDVVDVEGKRVSHVDAVVARDLDVSLLGQTYLARIGSVQMNGDYMRLN